MRVATVCGGAEGVWAEFERTRRTLLRVLRPGDYWLRLACNAAGIEHPSPLLHWCTLHHENMHRWQGARAEKGRWGNPTTWGVASRPVIDEIQRVWKGGSSGLLCVDVALHRLSADAVILCGVPMDERRNRFTGKEWGAAPRFWLSWERARSELQGRVTSWSGETRKMLGSPTETWLEEVRGGALLAGEGGTVRY